MNSFYKINAADCITLQSSALKTIRKRSEPKLSTASQDPRITIIGTGTQCACNRICAQRGLLLMNDGTEADLETWRRFSLGSPKPIESFSLNEGVKSLLEIPEAVAALRNATMLIIPGGAAPRVLAAVQAIEPSILNSDVKIATPTPNRTLDLERRASVSLDKNDARDLQAMVTPDDRIVILDDVASTYKTAVELATTCQEAADIQLLTVISAIPKPERVAAINESPINNMYAGIVTRMQGGAADFTPPITTAASVFADTAKAKLSFENMQRYLPDSGIGLDILRRRLEGDVRLLLLDLDRTVLTDGVPNMQVLTLLNEVKAQCFRVAATGRSPASYARLQSTGVTSVFDAAIVSNGGNIVCSDNVTSTLSRKVSPQEVQKYIGRAAFKTGCKTKVTDKISDKEFPWWVRIRAKDGDIKSPDFTDEDTAAAFEFADAINNDNQFSAQPSGNGDVVISWPGTDKGLSGLSGLASRLPTLPPLNNAIAVGDGPNDEGLFQAVSEAGGITIAVDPVTQRLRELATIVTTQAELYRALKEQLLPSPVAS